MMDYNHAKFQLISTKGSGIIKGGHNVPPPSPEQPQYTLGLIGLEQGN